ncbi:MULTISPECIES: LytTR family DNA-binding domain-containing protein [unclassified Spirosoma]|uniref:LytR/AlgR family response regulator transcription factor n=1 Tax=unclassified Spirosoma TaxID=2621999 RepID=UPI00095A92CA|nr:MULTISPECIES: response regulator transcription factor [unclassified Spirosoma]MBN8820611.1 response regulator transcription factor [Spirosoma sp.]OJW71735.1 MAG: DNA-binding response regulator [Spirosoma sp. 48-14]
MIRAIALDDEPPALRILSHFCQQVDFIDLSKTFTRTDEALRHLNQVQTDLLFLDINMPSISGIDFYRAISPTSASSQLPMVIFTTAYAEYAVEGFTLNAVDYLLKPFTFERFLQAANKAADFYRWQQRDDSSLDSYVYVRADYTLHKLALADILFIEGLDDYLKIHLDPNSPHGPRPIVARMTMKAMQERLVNANFMRVHRSYIVPLNRIEAVRNKTLFIASREVPVGASYEAEFLNRFGK